MPTVVEIIAAVMKQNYSDGCDIAILSIREPRLAITDGKKSSITVILTVKYLIDRGYLPTFAIPHPPLASMR
jgi:hypothetical protein